MTTLYSQILTASGDDMDTSVSRSPSPGPTASVQEMKVQFLNGLTRAAEDDRGSHSEWIPMASGSLGPVTTALNDRSRDLMRSDQLVQSYMAQSTLPGDFGRIVRLHVRAEPRFGYSVSGADAVDTNVELVWTSGTIQGDDVVDRRYHTDAHRYTSTLPHHQLQQPICEYRESFLVPSDTLKERVLTDEGRQLQQFEDDMIDLVNMSDDSGSGSGGEGNEDPTAPLVYGGVTLQEGAHFTWQPRQVERASSAPAGTPYETLTFRDKEWHRLEDIVRGMDGMSIA